MGSQEKHFKDHTQAIVVWHGSFVRRQKLPPWFPMSYLPLPQKMSSCVLCKAKTKARVHILCFILNYSPLEPKGGC